MTDRRAGHPTRPAFPDGGSVVTVGTFDGVHRGHWQILESLTSAADADRLRSVLVTFDPHPLYVLRPEVAPRLLTAPDEKIEILAESGIDYVAFLPFDTDLARYAPRRFVEEILIGRFRLRHLVIGYDHGFGRDRSGDVDTLRAVGSELGFRVDVEEAVEIDGQPISSTSIRRALEKGDVQLAARSLARPYSLQGTVVRGAGQGRALGFPTANVEVAYRHKLIPRDGIYAVRAILRDGVVDGVLHVGPRPTFAGLPASIEIHLFDFSGDLYGRKVKVEFHARIRDVQRFSSTTSLVRAMAADCEAARSILARARLAAGGVGD